MILYNVKHILHTLAQKNSAVNFWRQFCRLSPALCLAGMNSPYSHSKTFHITFKVYSHYLAKASTECVAWSAVSDMTDQWWHRLMKCIDYFTHGLWSNFSFYATVVPNKVITSYSLTVNAFHTGFVCFPL